MYQHGQIFHCTVVNTIGTFPAFIYIDLSLDVKFSLLSLCKIYDLVLILSRVKSLKCSILTALNLTYYFKQKHCYCKCFECLEISQEERTGFALSNTDNKHISIILYPLYPLLDCRGSS